jgi:N-acylneuraminate cytidylyltransferase/CMP-N,N'-diacetyllegionaminic acid synthase
MMQTPSVNAVVGCYAIHRNLTTLFRINDSFLQPLDAEAPIQTSRQQEAPLLTPNGALYLCKTAQLLERQSLYPPKTLPLLMNSIQSLDIDTEEDWRMAEAFIHQGLI